MNFEEHIQDIFVGNIPREPGRVVDITTNMSATIEDLSRVIKFYIEFSHKEVVPKNSSVESARKRFIEKLRFELYKDLYEDLILLQDAVAEERKGLTADLISKIITEIRGDNCKRYGQ